MKNRSSIAEPTSWVNNYEAKSLGTGLRLKKKTISRPFLEVPVAWMSI